MEKPSFVMDHVCINGQNHEEATAIAQAIAAIFDLPVTQKPTSVYAGSGVEVAKADGPGTKGHIGFATSDINAAVEYLEAKGVQLDYTRKKLTEDGRLRLIYLKNEVGGFALHIIQK